MFYSREEDENWMLFQNKIDFREGHVSLCPPDGSVEWVSWQKNVKEEGLWRHVTFLKMTLEAETVSFCGCVMKLWP